MSEVKITNIGGTWSTTSWLQNLLNLSLRLCYLCHYPLILTPVKMSHHQVDQNFDLVIKEMAPLNKK